MSKQSIIISLSVIIVVVIGLVIFQSSSQELNQQPESEPATTTTSDEEGIERTIDALHQYLPEEGRHIIAGTTTVPTPCHQLTTETEIRESDPEEVVVSFAAQKQNEDEMCAQVIQNRRFKIAVQASESANIIGGTFGNDKVELNLREVGSEENLDDFQIYTKG